MAELTDKEKRAVSAGKMKEKRGSAKAVIKAFLADGASKRIEADLRTALEYLTGTGQRSERATATNALKALLIEKGRLSAVEVFTLFEYGRPTMEQKIRNFIKADPEKRIWVTFDKGNYIVAGTGANAPEGWTGYVPVAEVEL